MQRLTARGAQRPKQGCQDAAENHMLRSGKNYGLLIWYQSTILKTQGAQVKRKINEIGKCPMSNEKLTGAIDQAQSMSTFSGWAKYLHADITSSAKVHVALENEVIASSSINMYRPDIGGNFGFKVQAPFSLSPKLFEEEKVKFLYVCNGKAVGEIKFFKAAFEQFKAYALGKELFDAFMEVNEANMRDFFRGFGVDNFNKIQIEFHRPMRSAKDLTEANDLSMLPVPIGTYSVDRVACVGHEGFLFLAGGSNNLLRQYEVALTDPVVAKKSAEWINAFVNRKNIIEKNGARFIQMVIPEKTSLLSEYFPEKINPPSALYRRTVSSRSLSADWFMDVYKIFSEHPDKKLFFRKLDTHLTVRGAVVIMNAILEILGESLRINVDCTKNVIRKSDLGPKLHPFFEKEVCEDIDSDKWRHIGDGVQLVEEALPPAKGHIGTRLVFKNEKAPLNIKAIAFGNSFFERGGSATGLTWWSARVFREFHFLWSPDVNLEYIESISPDLVISQTIERFLSRPPAQ